MASDSDKDLERAEALYGSRDFPEGDDSEEIAELRRLMHSLSLENHEPARALFVRMLDEANTELRATAVAELGAWEGLNADNGLMKKLRGMLLGDPDRLTRASVAILLGTQSRWPDADLERALSNDPERNVRLAAFQALLDLRLGFDVAQSETEPVRQERAEPTAALLNEIIARRATSS